MADKKEEKTVKKVKEAGRRVKVGVVGRVYVTSTFNNTLVTITNADGEALAWSSTGKVGFKGTKKSTPYAATMAVDQAVKKAQEEGVKEVEVYIKGPGPGRDAALRVLRAAGVKINMISDVTPIPHDGVRPPKVRRV